ncbi:MAG TPA: hypothetical protein VFD13_08810 [Candidatus Kapabacteria bacterium]|nr:hypothetical protein [Candidatus Kapabacteria bacterium]
MLHNRIILLLLFCGVASAGCSRHLPAGEHNNFHPYGVEHAALHFEYFGDIRGTEDFFIDSFGTREAHIIHSELITDKGFRPTITYSIRTGSDITVVDSVQHVEVKLLDRMMDSIYHLLPSQVPTPQAEFGNVFVPKAFHLAGDTTILGLKADIWEHHGTPGFMLEWRGLVVGSMDINEGHEHELRLISVDTTNPIDPARFVPPSGFPVHDVTKPGGAPMPPLNP